MARPALPWSRQDRRITDDPALLAAFAAFRVAERAGDADRRAGAGEAAA
jgi:hypothetical protein